MASKLGNLIKEARKNAGLTQESLAKKVGGGMTATEIGKVERGEATPSIAVLKRIAKATGVTQVSLLTAVKGAEKPTAATAAPTGAKISLRVTATEKQLVTAYRKADSDTKKAALNVLRGKCSDLVPTLVGSSASASGQTQGSVSEMITDVIGNLLGKQS